MFIDEIDTFLQETGMPESAFGRRFAGTPNFVSRLRNGGTAMEATIMKIRQRMKAYQAGHGVNGASEDSAVS